MAEPRRAIGVVRSALVNAFIEVEIASVVEALQALQALTALVDLMRGRPFRFYGWGVPDGKVHWEVER